MKPHKMPRRTHKGNFLSGRCLFACLKFDLNSGAHLSYFVLENYFNGIFRNYHRPISPSIALGSVRNLTHGASTWDALRVDQPGVLIVGV